MSGVKIVGKNLALVTYNTQMGLSMKVSFGKGNENEKLVDADSAISEDSKRRKDKTYYRRGKNDDRLLKMHKLANESPNKWQILETKANFVAGGGLYLFDEEVLGVNGFPLPVKSKDFKAWAKRLKLKSYLRAAAYQLVFSDELNVHVSLDAKTNKVKFLNVLDNNTVRAALLNANDTDVKVYLVSNDFGYEKNVKASNYKELPAFDPENPTKHGDFIIHLHAEKPGQKFYGFPSWLGTEKWSEVSNQVPEYYTAIFKNGIVVTHHISVPEDYFYEENQTQEEEDAAKEEWLKGLQETLSGVEESGKLVVTFSKFANDGTKAVKEVKIEPIENKINDQAFIKMLEIANGLQLSGHGMPGVLSGIDHSNSQGTSGREVIAQANYVQDFLTAFYRSMLLEPLEVIKEIDKIEDELELGIKRISSYTVDVTPKNDVSHPKQSAA